MSYKLINCFLWMESLNTGNDRFESASEIVAGKVQTTFLSLIQKYCLSDDLSHLHNIGFFGFPADFEQSDKRIYPKGQPIKYKDLQNARTDLSKIKLVKSGQKKRQNKCYKRRFETLRNCSTVRAFFHSFKRGGYQPDLHEGEFRFIGVYPLFDFKRIHFFFLSIYSCCCYSAKKRCATLLCQSKGLANPGTPTTNRASNIPDRLYGHTDPAVPEFLKEKIASFSIRTALLQLLKCQNNLFTKKKLTPFVWFTQ